MSITPALKQSSESLVQELRQETKLDPSHELPQEMMLTIFSYLNCQGLRDCCLVNKKWKQLASNEDLWRAIIYNEVAFGKQKWSTYFGDIGEEPPLPKNIREILSATCPIWPEKTIAKTHMLVLIPATVDKQPLTLNSLRKLIQVPKKGEKNKYGFYRNEIKKEHGYKSVSKSYWVLMTKDVVKGSRDKSYGDQVELAGELANKAKEDYQVPQALEAAVCICMTYVSGERLYRNNPATRTRCQEKASSFQVVVGGFSSAGLIVGCFTEECRIGVALLRKFLAFGT